MRTFLYVITSSATLLCLIASLSYAQPLEWTPVGVGGGGALFQPSFSPHTVDELYLTCDMSEVFHTTDLGASWKVIDFRSLQGWNRYGAMGFTSSASTLYTVSQAGDNSAPKKSTDGGVTWSTLATDPTGGDVWGLAVDPNTTTNLLLADYKNIYYSTNGGTTFQLRYTARGAGGAHIAGAFFDGSSIYVGTNDGLLVSTNSGTTFSLAAAGGIPAGEGMVSFAGAKQNGIIRFYCVTLDTSDLYSGITGADYGAFKGVYSKNSTDPSWTSRTAAIPSGVYPFYVGTSRTTTNTVYLSGGSDASSPIVLKSTDGGAGWSDVLRTANNANVATGWSGQGGDRDWSYGEYALGFAVSPVDPNRLAITDLGFVHLSSDGGTSWHQGYVARADENPAGAATPPRRAYHSVALENTTCWRVAWFDSLAMFACFSDMRGNISSDGGASWGFNYTGHTLNSMYYVVKHPTTGTVYGATSSAHDMYQSTYLQDSRIDGASGQVLSSVDNGHTWTLLHNFNHPVIWLALDPANPNRMYASVIHSTQGGIFVSNDIQNGATSVWTRLTPPTRTEGHPFNIQVLSDGTLLSSWSGRRNPAGTFTASSGVFISTNGGTSWIDRSSTKMNYWTKDVVVDPHDAAQNTWYAGVFSGWGGAPNGLGGLYRTTDRGLNWTKILDKDRVTSCTVDPRNPNAMYATTEVDGLWYTTNARAASPNFVQVAGYPFRQPERVFFNPYRYGEVWASSFGNGMRRGFVGGASDVPEVAPNGEGGSMNLSLNDYPRMIVPVQRLPLDR